MEYGCTGAQAHHLLCEHVLGPYLKSMCLFNCALRVTSAWSPRPSAYRFPFVFVDIIFWHPPNTIRISLCATNRLAAIINNTTQAPSHTNIVRRMNRSDRDRTMTMMLMMIFYRRFHNFLTHQTYSHECVAAAAGAPINETRDATVRWCWNFRTVALHVSNQVKYLWGNGIFYGNRM